MSALKIRPTEEGLAQHRPMQPTDSNGTAVIMDMLGVEEVCIKTTLGGYMVNTALDAEVKSYSVQVFVLRP